MQASPFRLLVLQDEFTTYYIIRLTNEVKFLPYKLSFCFFFVFMFLMEVYQHLISGVVPIVILKNTDSIMSSIYSHIEYIPSVTKLQSFITTIFVEI